nr:diguanylate cyclase [Saccharibacillus sp. JS10]
MFAFLAFLLVFVFFTVRITNLHKVYFVFHFFMMLWPLCQFATHIVQDVDIQFMYVSLSFVASSMLASGWLLFTLFLTGDDQKVSRKSMTLLFIPAILSSLGAVFNPFYLFTSPKTNNYVDRAYGPLFWLTMIVIAGYLLISLFILLNKVRSYSTTKSLKKQIRIILAGIYTLVFFAALDTLFNVVLTAYFPVIPGLTSLGILIADLFFIFVIMHYKVFDLVSIAHDDIINTIPHGILVLDEDHMIIEANRASQVFVNKKVGDLFDIDLFFTTVHHTDHDAEFLEHYKAKEQGLFHIELLFKQKSELHFILQTSPIFDASQVPIGHILTFQDVSQERRLVQELNRQNELLHERNRSLDRTRLELSKANRKLEEMALTDSLTGCYNRHYLTQRLTQEMNANIQQKIPFAFILFDIDFFKTINDRYGHVSGDEVLYRTAQIVKQEIRSSDILARYGGEEFILYLPCTDRDRAAQIAEQVRLSVEQNIMNLSGSTDPVSVTISLGVLAITDFDTTYNEMYLDDYLNSLFAEVDKPLYEAKNRGRNCIQISDVFHVSQKEIREAEM